MLSGRRRTLVYVNDAPYEPTWILEVASPEQVCYSPVYITFLPSYKMNAPLGIC